LGSRGANTRIRPMAERSSKRWVMGPKENAKIEKFDSPRVRPSLCVHKLMRISNRIHTETHPNRVTSYGDAVSCNPNSCARNPNSEPLDHQESDSVKFLGEVDRVYGPTAEVLSIKDGKRTVEIKKDAGFPDAVVWNPWVDKARWEF
jgi:hypothetical protein